jgi:hypothetical protein
MLGNADDTQFTAKAVEYLGTNNKNNNLLKTDVTDYDACFELCRTTPDCDGFNYSQEKCTLYRKIDDISPKIFLYRDW